MNEPSSFPLLDLPAEIRNAIYKMASLDFQHHCAWCGEVHSSNEVVSGPGKPTKGRHQSKILVLDAHDAHESGERLFYDAPRKHPFVPPLLQTCRQVRTEASALHYEENHFTLEVVDMDLRPLYDWIKMLACRSKLLEHLELNVVGCLMDVDFGEFLEMAVIPLRSADILAIGGRSALSGYLSKGMEALKLLQTCGFDIKNITRIMEMTTREISLQAILAQDHYHFDYTDDETYHEEVTEGREWNDQCETASDLDEDQMEASDISEGDGNR